MRVAPNVARREPLVGVDPDLRRQLQIDSQSGLSADYVNVVSRLLIWLQCPDCLGLTGTDRAKELVAKAAEIYPYGKHLRELADRFEIDDESVELLLAAPARRIADLDCIVHWIGVIAPGLPNDLKTRDATEAVLLELCKLAVCAIHADDRTWEQEIESHSGIRAVLRGDVPTPKWPQGVEEQLAAA